MKKITILYLFTLLAVAASHQSIACAVVELSGPSTLYIDTPDEHGGKGTYKVLNTEDHVWPGYHHTSWDFVLGSKVGQVVTYSPAGSSISPGNYTITATGHFYDTSGRPWRTQEAKQNVSIRYGADFGVVSPDLATNPGREFTEDSSYGVNILVKNFGPAKTFPTNVKVYWSYDSDWDSSDFLAGSISNIGGFSPNQEVTYYVSIKTPKLASGLPWNNMYCLFIIDPENSIRESKESNNISSYLHTINSKSSGGRVGISELNSSQQLNFNIYPNPSNGSFTINITNEENSTTFIKLIDIHGKEILSFEESKSGNFQKDVNLKETPPGIYQLQLISSAGTAITKKIIIE